MINYKYIIDNNYHKNIIFVKNNKFDIYMINMKYTKSMKNKNYNIS